MPTPIYYENSTHMCDYGCDQPAHYLSRSKKWRCSKNVSLCSGVQAKKKDKRALIPKEELEKRNHSMAETRRKNGSYKSAPKKANKTKQKIDNDGKSIQQRATSKARETALSNINGEGLNSYEVGSRKGLKKRLEVNQVTGKTNMETAMEKVVKVRKNDIDENGKDSYHRGG